MQCSFPQGHCGRLLGGKGGSLWLRLKAIVKVVLSILFSIIWRHGRTKMVGIVDLMTEGMCCFTSLGICSKMSFSILSLWAWRSLAWSVLVLMLLINLCSVSYLSSSFLVEFTIN